MINEKRNLLATFSWWEVVTDVVLIRLNDVFFFSQSQNGAGLLLVWFHEM